MHNIKPICLLNNLMEQEKFHKFKVLIFFDMTLQYVKKIVCTNKKDAAGFVQRGHATAE